jgi:methylglyoxal synthase
MEIAIIASDRKKELMMEFCLAYKAILAKHNLYATESTGKYISDATGLHIECLMPGSSGGVEQLSSRISYNEIDLVLYFRNPMNAPYYNEAQHNLLRLCDIYNVPVATNIATAEALILALDQGSLDWRELVNPKFRK